MLGELSEQLGFKSNGRVRIVPTIEGERLPIPPA